MVFKQTRRLESETELPANQLEPNEPGPDEGPVEQPQARPASLGSAVEFGGPLSGTAIAEIELAHAAVVEAEERARHPQAGPLARPRLEAAKKAEQELLDRYGFASYLGATTSAFRIRFPRAHLAPPGVDTFVENTPSPAPYEVEDAVPTQSSSIAGPSTDGDYDQEGNQQMQDSLTDNDRKANEYEDDQGSAVDALLDRLRADAAAFVDAEVRKAHTTSADIVEAARVEARTSTELAKKLQEAAAGAAATTTSELESLLGLIDDLGAKLSSARSEVQSRVDVLSWASSAVEQPSPRGPFVEQG
jgi:hypothetical protein